MTRLSVFLNIGDPPAFNPAAYPPVPYQNRVRAEMEFPALGDRNQEKAAFVLFQHAVNCGNWNQISFEQARAIWNANFAPNSWQAFLRGIHKLANSGLVHLWLDPMYGIVFFYPDPNLGMLEIV